MRRALPTRLAVGAVLLLAGVLAATSHASAWAAPREGVADVGQLLATLLLSFSVGFAVAGGYVLWRRRSGGAVLRGVFPAAVVLSVLLSLVGISNLDLHMEAPAEGVARSESDSGRPGIRLIMDWGGSAFRPPEGESSDEDLLPSNPGRVLFTRMLLLVGAVAVALVVRARRRAGPATRSGLDPLDPRARSAARGAVITTIDAMLADADPRTAIIGAYARLLEELEAIGAPRMTYEGPQEHLHRVLSVLEVPPTPLRRLIDLFAVARFSEHALTTGHRDDALAALRAVATSLAMPAAVS